MRMRNVWQKSSYSQEGGECVELAALVGAGFALRESDDPDTILTAQPTQLRILLAGIKAGTLDELPRPV